MQSDLEAHYPSSDISIIAVNEEGEESANSVAADLTDLPLLQDVDANNDNDSDMWEEWGAAWRDVRIIDADGELAAGEVMNLTDAGNDLRDSEPYERLKAQIISVATDNRVAETKWQNRVEPLDSNNDGFVSPADVLTNVQKINQDGAGALEEPTGELTTFHDVNGDGFIAPNDVLETVIHLNRNDTSGSGEPPAAAADAIFASLAAFQDSQDEDEDAA